MGGDLPPVTHTMPFLLHPPSIEHTGAQRTYKHWRQLTVPRGYSRPPVSRNHDPAALKGLAHVPASPPRPRLRAVLLRGITQGFRFGFDRGRPLKAGKRNMRSASEHPEVIDEFLREEGKAGRILGPFYTMFPPVHVSRCGVIPKGHHAGGQMESHGGSLRPRWLQHQ